MACFRQTVINGQPLLLHGPIWQSPMGKPRTEPDPAEHGGSPLLPQPLFSTFHMNGISTILAVVLQHITDWFVKRVTVMFRPVGEKAARRGERRRRVRRRRTRRPHCRQWQVSFFTVIDILRYFSLTDILRYSLLIDILKYSPMCPQAFQLSNCIFELACLLSNWRHFDLKSEKIKCD